MCCLSQFINLMGVEQKGKHFYPHLAHYTNGCMYALLVDSLVLTSMSANNCHLLKKLRIDQLNGDKRAKINKGFHSWSLYLKHELIHYKNIQAVKQGTRPPFHNVQELPPDKGE